MISMNTGILFFVFMIYILLYVIITINNKIIKYYKTSTSFVSNNESNIKNLRLLIWSVYILINVLIIYLYFKIYTNNKNNNKYIMYITLVILLSNTGLVIYNEIILNKIKNIEYDKVEENKNETVDYLNNLNIIVGVITILNSIYILFLNKMNKNINNYNDKDDDGDRDDDDYDGDRDDDDYDGDRDDNYDECDGEEYDDNNVNEDECDSEEYDDNNVNEDEYEEYDYDKDNSILYIREKNKENKENKESKPKYEKLQYEYTVKTGIVTPIIQEEINEEMKKYSFDLPENIKKNIDKVVNSKQKILSNNKEINEFEIIPTRRKIDTGSNNNSSKSNNNSSKSNNNSSKSNNNSSKSNNNSSKSNNNSSKSNNNSSKSNNIIKSLKY
jgi:hypothetical protein